MKKYRMLSMLTAISLLFSLVTPALAVGTEDFTSPINIAQEVSTFNESFVQIDEIENATYYSEKTDGYTIAIGLYSDVIDCSIRYHETESVYSGIIPIEEVASMISGVNSGNIFSQFEILRNAVLDGSLPLPALQVYEAPNSTTSVRAVSDSDKTKIMNELYNEGWPKAYSGVLRGTLTQSGITARLYHTLYYNITGHDYTFVAAKTALGAVITMLGLPLKTVRDIIGFALSVDGIWQTIQDVKAGKRDVSAVENKIVEINGTQPYWAGRTTKWTAVTGDIGAALNLVSENKHADFFDNTELLRTGLRLYANM